MASENENTTTVTTEDGILDLFDLRSQGCVR